MLAESNSAPTALLFVEVPLRVENPPRLAGVIQFLMDGSTMAAEYAELDRNLVWKFSAAFLTGALILVAGLGLALRRVQQANQKLARRTHDLLQANRELALAARTSAVGAVTAHLIHGLKNPLSGLRQFVHSHPAAGGDTEWQSALGTTQRMEELINRVVRVLQEQQTGVAYEISISELLALLAAKAAPLAKANGIRFEMEARFDGNVSNREADLILLILENLVQNAVEATPAGREVKVTVTDVAGVIHFEVQDQGPGLPAGLESRLFLPCTSGKKDGGGIGLAISKQLAQSLGGRLELVANRAFGCTFRLAVLSSPVDIKSQTVGARILG
jgi:signal transduction histidine kinase